MARPKRRVEYLSYLFGLRVFFEEHFPSKAIMAKPILLSVDDDSDVLRAIERDLRSQYGAEYRVIGSDSPEGRWTS